jgi:NAD(P)H dehydrogenase (quinone)
MTRILVTGATGNIGRLTLRHLLKRRPAGDLVGLARDPDKAADLAAAGIEIRKGDYLDRETLAEAFAGIDTLMLVSATAFTDRDTQHRNAVEAARAAGVRHVVAMPIIREEGSSFVMPQVTEEDRRVEALIKASGLGWTFLAHPPFLESIDFYVGGDALESGVAVPPGAGKAGFAAREDLAEAHAVVLSDIADGATRHDGRAYALYGEPAVSFADIATLLSAIAGRDVPYVTVSDEAYIARLVARGLPAPAAAFALAWVKGINEGAWNGRPGDLETLLGRKPLSPEAFLRARFAGSEE